MRAGLASKVYLGVTVCAAAGACGGCQTERSSAMLDASPGTRSTGVATAPDPTSLAVADRTPIRSPSVPAELMSTDADVPVVSQNDVIAWVARGTTDDVILDRLQHARNAIRLTAGEEMRLRDAGATDEVIRAIKATAWN